MSLENDDWNALEEIPETRKVKYSYSRDFLLSLSELDVCKKLPSGFDQSIISEFEEASLDRPRNVGTFSLNSFRRNDYGSSPPSKGDLSSYSKVVHGRWESRSSGRSDKDNDSISSWDSESGRRCGNQSRRSWQNPEHDGLLGSGSFPRPSGYVSGASAPKAHADDPYQLNKTSEPYHPPRPSKGIRRENNDSYNNETFGSSESTSDDKVEEEKKRRASFEMMRKEQHKALQQKQNLTEGKREDKLNVTVPSEDSIDEKQILLNRSSESDDPFTIQTSVNDMEKSSFPSQTLAVRPLVPPGFSNSSLERNSGTKFVVPSHFAEVDNSKLNDKAVQSRSNDLPREKFDCLGDNQLTIEIDVRDKQFRKISSYHSSHKNGGEILYLSHALDGNKSAIISEPQQASLDFEGSKKGTDDSGAVKKNQGHSTSILETLFGNPLTIDDGSSTNLVEHDDGKGVDSWSPQNPQSSKFAQWFLEEAEKRPVSNISVNGPNELLSLIVRNEKGGHEVSGVKSTHYMEPSFPPLSCKTAENQMTAYAISPSIVMSDQLHDNRKTGAVPTVLTCADLEQSILLEISESGPNSQPSGDGWRFPESDASQLKSSIDDHASQHLLSLLQKEVDEKNRAFLPSNMNMNRSQGFEEASVSNDEGKTDAKSSLGENLTLETIFGTAFMRELQSVGAPVSVQAGVGAPARVESQGLPLPIIDEVLSSANGSGSHVNSQESRILASNHRHQNIDSSSLQTGFGFITGAFHDLAEIQLPEENSLVTRSHPENLQYFVSAGHSSKPQVDTAENLSVMNSLSRDGRSIMGGQHGSIFGGPYDLREAEVAYQKQNMQSLVSHFHLREMDRRGLSAMNSLSQDGRSIMGGQHGSFFGGPDDLREAEVAYQKQNMQSLVSHFQPPEMDRRGLFHSLEPHTPMDSWMKFMRPENPNNRDPLLNHRFSPNMLHPPFLQPNSELASCDPSSLNPLLSQVQMPGNLPPHLLQGLSMGASLPPFTGHGNPLPPHINRGSSTSQMNNQVPDFAPEVNSRQGLRIGQQHPNSGGLGSAANIIGGSNNPIPEAAQRLLEMELRLNLKKNNHFHRGGHNQGMYGKELDTNFGYR